MKRNDIIIGSVGAALLLFSFVLYTIENIWGTTNWISLLLGVAGIGYFLFVYYKNREKGISKRNLQYGSNVKKWRQKNKMKKQRTRIVGGLMVAIIMATIGTVLVSAENENADR